MEVIKRIPNWQEFYPAFYLCDQLNTNGVSGWYLPAINESSLINCYYIWTSTEISSDYAIVLSRYEENIYKGNETYSVYAVHKF